jgi:hypothetical protein
VGSVAAARRQGQTTEELHASDYEIYAYLQNGQGRSRSPYRDFTAGNGRTLRSEGIVDRVRTRVLKDLDSRVLRVTKRGAREFFGRLGLQVGA